MAKEFTAERLGKMEDSPRMDKDQVKELAGAAGAEGSAAPEAAPSHDAMAPGAGQQANSAQQGPVRDNDANQWSETHAEQNGDVTYNYRRDPMNMQTMYAFAPRTDENGNNVAYDDPKNSLMPTMGEGRDVSDPTMEDDRYVSTGKFVSTLDNGRPRFSDLAVESPQGTPIKYMQGTMQNPNTCHEIDNSTLFIGGTTSAEDIHQGNVADCYFLAALLQVIHYDPSKIVDMMQLMGDTVVTRFYHKEGDRWNPVCIQTKLGLIARDNVNSNNPNGMYYMGAMPRISYDPVTAGWYSNIDGNTLKINKVRYHQAALWVNCMEQAFSLYSQKFGQYGRGGDSWENQATERYQRISFGLSSLCLNMLYGDDASNPFSSYEEIKNESHGDDNVEANYWVINDLLSLAKCQDGNDPNVQDNIFLTAHVSTNEVVSRLQFYTEKLKEEVVASGDQDLQGAVTSLDYIADQVSHYFDTGVFQGREGGSTDTQRVIRENLDRTSNAIEQNQVFGSKIASMTSYDKFRTTLATVVSFTANDQDAVNGANIYIYSNHAYNIDHVEFRDAQNQSLNNKDIDTVMDNLDLKKSTLRLQNPHGVTKAAMHKTEERNGQGDFETTLELFLANMETLTVAQVKKDSTN